MICDYLAYCQLKKQKKFHKLPIFFVKRLELFIMECYNYYTHGEVAIGDILHEFFSGLLQFNCFFVMFSRFWGWLQ